MDLSLQKLLFMKNSKFAILIITALLLTGCFSDQDDNIISASEVNDFIWKGMNLAYLYKDEIPNLANDRFSSDEEYATYLNGFDDPEALFESLIYNRQTVDRFSWIVDDFLALEQQLSGTTLSNGMEFSLRRVTPNSDAVFGYVRYVLPGTSAENAGLQRGAIFSGIDGTSLTVDNFRTLLSPEAYAINLATFNDNGTPEADDDSVTPIDDAISLTKAPYTENPILINSVLNVNGNNVGYLMYNGFTGTDAFETELKTVFANFKANNVTDLVLDLRYNPGGSVVTATLLGSLITGQFNGEVYSRLIYNSGLQANNTDFNFSNEENSLNLNKVYVLTTGSSASASELVINSLDSYIEVAHIGTKTVGKSQASVTLYDSPDFSRNDVSPLHTYAMQPLVAISVNKNDGTVPADGLIPDTQISESISNLGILGDVNEPLLAEALLQIENTFSLSSRHNQPEYLVGDSNDFKPLRKEMYIDLK